MTKAKRTREKKVFPVYSYGHLARLHLRRIKIGPWSVIRVIFFRTHFLTKSCKSSIFSNVIVLRGKLFFVCVCACLYVFDSYTSCFCFNPSAEVFFVFVFLFLFFFFQVTRAIWLHCSGVPIEQYYDLTPLKKSNLRRNDELWVLSQLHLSH